MFGGWGGGGGQDVWGCPNFEVWDMSKGYGEVTHIIDNKVGVER